MNYEFKEVCDDYDKMLKIWDGFHLVNLQQQSPDIWQ